MSPLRAAALLACAGCNGTVVRVIDAPYNRLAWGIEVRDKSEVRASGRCVANDGSGETRILDEQGPATQFVLPVAGLLEDVTWDCTVDVDQGGAVDSHTVEIDDVRGEAGTGGYTVEGELPDDAYTLISSWNTTGANTFSRAELVDPLGRLRWYRYVDHDTEIAIDVNLTDDGRVLMGGGPDMSPTWFDALGDPVANLWEPPIPGAYDHHAQPMPDGGVLTLVETGATGPNGPYAGCGVVWFGGDGRVVWSWDCRVGVDAGTLPLGVPDEDPIHLNSVSVLDDADGPAAWINSYRLSRIFRIDRDSGEITHALGAGGDFTLQDPDGTPRSDWPTGMHDPEFRWPRVLVLDNGTGPDQSRGLELELDLDARTATVVWEWTEPGWFEPVFGDADSVADDTHVLFSRGRCFSCDWLPDRTSQLTEVDRQTGDVVWRLHAPDDVRGFYRAERVNPCTLWHDPDLCDDR